MRFLLVILLLIPVSLFAQGKTNVQFAPYSVKLWGRMPSTFTVQVQHRCFMAGYFHIRGSYLDEQLSPTRSNTLGLFFKPDVKVGEKVSLSPIIGVFNHRFPTANAAWWAFGLQANYNFYKHFSLYYQHISNGWLVALNPGLDNIGLKYTFTRKNKQQ